MKKAIKALWHGIKAVFTTVVDGLATLFGLNDNTKYGKSLRRIVGTAFAAVVVLWAAVTLVRFTRGIWRNVSEMTGYVSDEDVSLYKQFPSGLCYYESYTGNKGYLVNSDGKKVLKHIFSIAMPMEGDSLVYFSDGDKRGYFHMRDGHTVVKPIYEHAWIFSEGLAAVEEQGRIKFIDSDGKVVIDGDFAYNSSDDGYVFHKGLCAVNDITGTRKGLIDRSGNWVVPPVYTSILPCDSLWLLSVDNRQAILTFGLDTVFPLTDATFSIEDSMIKATFSDHTMRLYNMRGELIQDNMYYSVTQLTYDTRELVYPASTNSDDEYYTAIEPYNRKAVATCLLYEGEYGWYGLMSADGKPLTKPEFVSIEAVDKDLYLCHTDYSCGVLLNSKGQRVQ